MISEALGLEELLGQTLSNAPETDSCVRGRHKHARLDFGQLIFLNRFVDLDGRNLRPVC